MDVKIKDRKLLPDYHQIGMQGETGVETYFFTLPRFYNSVDLSLGVPVMLWQNGTSQQEGFVLLDNEQTEETLFIRWIVGKELTAEKGTLRIQLKIANAEAAIWKSDISICTIADSLPDNSPQSVVVQKKAARMRTLDSSATMMATSGTLDGPALMMSEPSTEPPITIFERKINIPPELQNIATQNDVASETVQIMLPRFFDGHDLSDKTKIYLKTLMPGAAEGGVAGRDDILFSSPRVESTEIWLTWELRPPQTSYPGKVQVQLYVVDAATGGNPKTGFKWETDPGAYVTIYKSLDAEPALPASVALLDAFRQEIQKLESAASASATAAKTSETAAAASKNEAQRIKNTMKPVFDVQAKKVGVKFPDEAAFVYTADLTGPQGVQGVPGPQGIQGPAGAQGPKGSTGAAGAQGADGTKGEQGEKGEPGAKGERGESGVMFEAAGLFGFYVSAAGDLMLLYNDGDTPPDFSIDSGGNLILTLT